MDSSGNSENFYRKLKSFKNFNSINSDEHYQELPQDWSIIITDIVGSTKAIEEGRYKDVNTLGAGAIAVVRNIMGGFDFPFVFGGDGATFLVHRNQKQKICEALKKLKCFSQNNFNLDLRIGIVDYQEVKQQGQKIKVARFSINPHSNIATIKGGGLSFADQIIKEQSERYCLKADTNSLAELEGLSCRWQPIKAKRGKILSLLVQPRDPNVLSKIISQLDEILDSNIEEAKPLNQSQMKYKGLIKCIADERKYNQNLFSWSFCKRFISILISVWSFKLKLPTFFDRAHYSAEILNHSDYRKLDDTLRMVIDCSESEISKIQNLLQDYYLSKKIYFGTHFSDHTLMTCLVESLQDGGHLHFIDGGNGGYAMAAKVMKAQIKSDSA